MSVFVKVNYIKKILSIPRYNDYKLTDLSDLDKLKKTSLKFLVCFRKYGFFYTYV